MDIRQLTKSIQKSVKQGCKQHRAKVEQKRVDFQADLDYISKTHNWYFDCCLDCGVSQFEPHDEFCSGENSLT